MSSAKNHQVPDSAPRRAGSCARRAFQRDKKPWSAIGGQHHAVCSVELLRPRPVGRAAHAQEAAAGAIACAQWLCCSIGRLEWATEPRAQQPRVLSSLSALFSSPQVTSGATAMQMRKKDIHPEWFGEAKVRGRPGPRRMAPHSAPSSSGQARVVTALRATWLAGQGTRGPLHSAFLACPMHSRRRRITGVPPPSMLFPAIVTRPILHPSCSPPPPPLSPRARCFATAWRS